MSRLTTFAVNTFNRDDIIEASSEDVEGLAYILDAMIQGLVGSPDIVSKVEVDLTRGATVNITLKDDQFVGQLVGKHQCNLDIIGRYVGRQRAFIHHRDVYINIYIKGLPEPVNGTRVKAPKKAGAREW